MHLSPVVAGLGSIQGEGQSAQCYIPSRPPPVYQDTGLRRGLPAGDAPHTCSPLGLTPSQHPSAPAVLTAHPETHPQGRREEAQV